MVGIGISQQKYGNNKTPFAARGRDSLDFTVKRNSSMAGKGKAMQGLQNRPKNA
jgi:hypothetical protein